MKTRLSLAIASSLLTFCASNVATPDAPETAPQEVASAASTSESSADWRARVTQARAIEDPALRAQAMLELLRAALPDREFRLSGEKHADAVHPDDNQPAPIVNFDPRLNQKTSARPRSGAATRSLQNNFGYYFSRSGVPYVVVGPAALDPRGPVFTQLAVEHEMYHAENHPGDRRSLDDRELETWSHMFVRYFDDIHQYKQRWAPMLAYYRNASPEERVLAIDRLAGYYRATSSADVRTAFEEWIARRKADSASSQLIADLEKAVGVSAPPSQAEAPSQPQPQPQPQPSASEEPLSEWGKKVTAANALEDESAKGASMLALLREALPSHEVVPSGNAHPDQVHPEDNQPAPVVNFDVNLNEKLSYATNAVRLATSRAYYFLGQGTPYVVVGPRVFDPRSPAFTRMQVAHELFHAANHVGDGRPIDDRELETWTHVFVQHFEEIYPFKQRWAPLVQFYERADPGERKASLDKLVQYRASAGPAVRAAFDEWLERRRKDPATADSQLVADVHANVAR